MSKRLKELLVRPDPDAREIAEYFDGLALGDAISAVRSLSGRRLQRALWECVSVNATVHVADLVPPDYQPMRPVVFHGKNSLPAFTQFKKICCRPPAAVTADVLWGYNENTIKSVIGPGYYVVHDTESNPYGGSAFDYTMLPEAHPDGWPRIRPNSAGLSRFIYQNTIDYMRRVATRVFIGSATRVEREIGSYARTRSQARLRSFVRSSLPAT